eukprot:613480-Pelagomonas_calceolata.AAC.1
MSSFSLIGPAANLLDQSPFAPVPFTALHLIRRRLRGKHMLRNIARFCLNAHTLRVETSLWQEHTPECGRRDQGGLQDEKHAVFLLAGTVEQAKQPLGYYYWLKVRTGPEVVGIALMPMMTCRISNMQFSNLTPSDLSSSAK